MLQKIQGNSLNAFFSIIFLQLYNSLTDKTVFPQLIFLWCYLAEIALDKILASKINNVILIYGYVEKLESI